MQHPRDQSCTRATQPGIPIFACRTRRRNQDLETLSSSKQRPCYQGPHSCTDRQRPTYTTQRRRKPGEAHASPDAQSAGFYFFSCATAASAAWKPSLLWVPSQNGLVTDAPHRHSANRGPRPLTSTLSPFTSTTSTSPSTRYGPLGRMVILTAIDIPPQEIWNSEPWRRRTSRRIPEECALHQGEP